MRDGNNTHVRVHLLSVACPRVIKSLV